MSDENLFTAQENDPLKKFFEDTTPIYNSPDVDEESDLPDEVKEIFSEYELHTHKYNCILKEIEGKTGTRKGGEAYIDSWYNKVPSIRYIALEYGPGEYQMLLNFQRWNPETKRKSRSIEKIEFTVSDKFGEAHEEYVIRKKIQKIHDRKKEMRNAKIKNNIDDDLYGLTPATQLEKDKKQDVIAYMKEIREAMQLLGMESGKGGSGVIDWQGILSLALPLVPQILQGMAQKAKQDQEHWNQIMMLLLNQSNANSSNLLEMMKAQKPENTSSGEERMNQMADMLFKAIDIKKAIDGQEESTSDKIFKMIESISGVMLPILMMPKQQREKNPGYNAAQAYVENSPDFQQLKENPELLSDLVKKLDNTFGWEQTDMIISNVGGYERPADCPRNENQRYPAGDERNGGSGETGETGEAEEAGENTDN